jgi:6-phosphogluconolactonase
MKITRRILFLLLFLIGAPTLLFAQAKEAAKDEAQKEYLAFVGTYTAKTNSKGIYAFRYDATSGKLTPLGVAAEAADPSFLVVHPNGKFLYAVNESGKKSMVSAFAIDKANGKLALLNQVPALGEDPCYISFDRSAKYVFVANYTSGNVVVLPVGEDGKLGAATANVRDEGKLGPSKERQDGPHAHWIEAAPDNRFVLVADLGLDRIAVYHLDSSKGTLTPNVPSFRPLGGGAGPRHAAFSVDGGHFYVLSELDSTVSTFAYAANHGVLGYLGVVPTLPAGYAGAKDNTTAEIAVHPSGKFLYASNRGHDSIAVYAIEGDGRKLTSKGFVPTGGKTPRHFAMDPSGNFLLAENQDSNSVVVFHIDLASGGLTPTGEKVEVPSPVDVVFVPAR